MLENNEGVQDPKDEIPDEETRKTLEDMKAEGGEVPALDDSKEEESKEEEVIETPEEKPEEEVEEEKETEEEKPNRIPNMMPAFKHKIAEKNWSKRETELLGEIETLKNKPTETPIQEAEANKDMDSKIAELAEEKGVDAELIKKIISLVPKQETPLEIKDALDSMKDLKAQQETVKADNQFNQEFSSIEPLIKTEYPDISEGDLSKLKQQLKDTAFTEEYAKTPLSVIYKGLDGFRGAVMTKKKSAESSRSGQNRASDVQDYSEWTDDDIANASRAEADKYFDWVDKNKTS